MSGWLVVCLSVLIADYSEVHWSCAAESVTEMENLLPFITPKRKG